MVAWYLFVLRSLRGGKMGLDLYVEGHNSENSKIGSYTRFGNFRNIWAKHLGFDLYEMEGFEGDKEWTNEPLQCFFNHSDHDGYLSVKDCKEILKQAQKDYPKLKDDAHCAYSFPILIEHCKAAIKNKRRIEFS